jgi:DNA-binding CsgD family transcriptional regulator
VCEVIEREPELEQLKAALDTAIAGSGATVLIRGPAGIGKTTLAGALRSRAGGRALVLSAAGGEIERALPWAVARELFSPAAPDARLTEAARGPAAHALAVLAGEPAPSPATTPSAPHADALGTALHGLYWLCSNLAGEGPLLIVIEDAHLADGPSLQLASYLAQRTRDLPLLLVLTARPPEPGHPEPLPHPLLAAELIVRPAPISPAGTAEFLKRAGCGPVDAAFAAVCHERTAGNPHLLTELARELRREGIGATESNLTALRALTPETIARGALLRLSRFSDSARRLAESVAVLGTEARLGDASRLAELDGDEAAEVAAELGAADVLARGLPLAYAHPIIRNAIYAELSPPRRSRLHHRAAAILAERRAPAGEVAIHLLRTEPEGDASVVERLRAAAAEALAQGAPESSAEFLERALEEAPSGPQGAAVLLELAEAESALGRATALEHLERALELVESTRERAEILFRLGWLLFNAGNPAEASRMFARGESELEPSDDPASGELASMLATARLGTGSLVGEVDIAELQALVDRPAESARSRTVAREVLTQLALASVFAAREHAASAELARRALGEGEALREAGVTLSFSIAASCLIWCDELAAAEREIDVALELMRERGDDLGAVYVRFGRSWVCYWSGRLAEAAADAETAARAWSGGGRLGGQLPLARYWQAISLLELARPEEARTALGELDPAWDPHYRLSWRIGRAKLALAENDAATAWKEIEELVEVGESTPFFHSPATFDWRSVAALAALRLGEADRAQTLAVRELELAEGFGSPRAIGISLRTRGMVRGGEDGLADLDRSVAVLERSPSRLEHCRSLVERGAMMRRNGAPSQAKESLSRGMALAHELGAAALERRAREELAAAGARPRRAMLSGPESLTPSELRVCELAAKGLSNREIAEQLFVGLRTVETHLTHAYRKLDVASRSGLAAALRSPDADDRPNPGSASLRAGSAGG